MTTWNPATLPSNYSLSNGNLTISPTSNTVAGNCVLSTTNKSTGKFYFEWTASAGIAGSGTESRAFGLANASQSNADFLGSTNNNSFGLFEDGTFFYNSNTGTNIGVTGAVACVIAMAVDIAGQLVWYKNLTLAGNWNNSGTANPATGVGGVSFAGINAGPYFMAGEADDAGPPADVVTGNFGGSSFTGTPPSGFSAWDIVATFATSGTRVVFV